MINGKSALLMAMLLSSCTSAPGEPAPVTNARSRVSSSDPAATQVKGPAVGGIVHSLSASRFDPGEARQSLSEHGFRKVQGSFGVFATDELTGAVIASRSTFGVHPGPFRGGADAHNTAVRDYFIGAGLEPAQIGSVVAHAALRGGGSATAGSDRPAAELTAYSSVLSRRAGAFRVAESVAWAEIGSDGRVVSETLYWPPIPGEVLLQAVAFQAMVDDPSGGKAYRASLPTDVEPLGVVIHHRPMDERVGFWARVTFDVRTKERGAFVRHFELTGAEATLSVLPSGGDAK